MTDVAGPESFLTVEVNGGGNAARLDRRSGPRRGQGTRAEEGLWTEKKMDRDADQDGERDGPRDIPHDASDAFCSLVPHGRYCI